MSLSSDYVEQHESMGKLSLSIYRKQHCCFVGFMCCEQASKMLTAALNEHKARIDYFKSHASLSIAVCPHLDNGEAVFYSQRNPFKALTFVNPELEVSKCEGQDKSFGVC